MILSVELSNEEHDILVAMCGFATGVAIKERNLPLARRMLLLTNKILADDPLYMPYDADALPALVRTTKH
jgi:hypothetical protein